MISALLSKQISAESSAGLETAGVNLAIPVLSNYPAQKPVPVVRQAGGIGRCGARSIPDVV